MSHPDFGVLGLAGVGEGRGGVVPEARGEPDGVVLARVPAGELEVVGAAVVDLGSPHQLGGGGVVVDLVDEPVQGGSGGHGQADVGVGIGEAEGLVGGAGDVRGA